MLIFDIVFGQEKAKILYTIMMISIKSIWIRYNETTVEIKHHFLNNQNWKREEGSLKRYCIYKALQLCSVSVFGLYFVHCLQVGMHGPKSEMKVFYQITGCNCSRHTKMKL